MSGDNIELVITSDDTYTVSASIDDGTGVVSIPGISADSTGKVVIDITSYTTGDVIKLVAVCDSDSTISVTKTYRV